MHSVHAGCDEAVCYGAVRLAGVSTLAVLTRAGPEAPQGVHPAIVVAFTGRGHLNECGEGGRRKGDAGCETGGEEQQHGIHDVSLW